MNELALFAGAGGGILGGKLLGWRTVCAVEWEPYAACVLAARQNDGFLPPFPIWDDVQTFDGRPWNGIVDVISGGFPCQDISAAGKGAGIDGERSGMWKEMARIIGEVRPRFVFVENSPMLTSRGLGTVLGDLATLGYDAEWGVVSAADTGAPHLRERIWIVGTDTQQRGFLSHPKLFGDGRRQQQPKSVEKESGTELADTMRNGLQKFGSERGTQRQAGLCGGEGRNQVSDILANAENKRNVRRLWGMGTTQAKYDYRRSQGNGGGEWWKAEPNVGRVANGVAARVDRLKAIGNGQVSRVAATAFELLRERLNEA